MRIDNHKGVATKTQTNGLRGEFKIIIIIFLRWERETHQNN